MKENQNKDNEFMNLLTDEAAAPSNYFKQKLKNQLLNSSHKQENYFLPRSNMKKFLPTSRLMYLSLVIVAVVGLVSPMVYLSLTEDSEKETQDTPVVVSQTATVSNLDGSATVNSENLAEGSTINVTDQLVTSEDTFVELSLEDGSYLRINENTTVTIAQLTEDNYTFELETGEVYARVTKSEREYVVQTDNYTYTALGTAYQVSNTEEENKLVVFHNSVLVEGEEFETIINEGEELINSTEATEINKETLSQEFIEYNKEQDTNNFSEELGVLPTITFEEETQPEETTETQNTQPNNGGGQAQAPAPAPAPQPAPAPSYPTGPAPLFPAVTLEAYAQYNQWQAENPSVACGATFANFTFADSSTMSLLGCGQYGGQYLLAQQKSGLRGIEMRGIVGLAIPVLINADWVFSSQTSQYAGNYTGANGLNVMGASDQFINAMIAAGYFN